METSHLVEALAPKRRPKEIKMTQPTTPQPTTVKFAVEGMNCGSCVRHIGEALSEQVQVLEQDIDLAAKTVTVTFDPAATSTDAIVKVLGDEGYTARPL